MMIAQVKGFARNSIVQQFVANLSKVYLVFDFAAYSAYNFFRPIYCKLINNVLYFLGCRRDSDCIKGRECNEDGKCVKGKPQNINSNSYEYN